MPPDVVTYHITEGNNSSRTSLCDTHIRVYKLFDLFICVYSVIVYVCVCVCVCVCIVQHYNPRPILELAK